MGIVDDGGIALRRMERLESSGYRHETAHAHKNFFDIPAEKHRGSIYSREIVGIELTGEKYLYLASVEGHRRTVKTAFDDASVEIGTCTE